MPRIILILAECPDVDLAEGSVGIGKVSDCSCTGENCTGSLPDHEDNRCESFGRGTTATARCARLRELPLDYATARLGASAVPWYSESESRATEAVVWNTETNAGDGTATATCRELTQVVSCGCYAHQSKCSTVYQEDEKRCTATAHTGGAEVTVWLRSAESAAWCRTPIGMRTISVDER